MHRIFMEAGTKPTVEAQRRLNPIMKEVVRVEVMKLLDAGIIYPISDSKWVSPTQVVPKKTGITVVKNVISFLGALTLEFTPLPDHFKYHIPFEDHFHAMEPRGV
ncbi:hypothetical protein ACFX2I_010997 [Malus domestica]